MDTAADRKLFLGARLKRLRRDLSLTQTAMAADLGVSPSYLNHIERNQRPVSAQLLLRLAETYDVDLRTLNQGGEADEARLAEALVELAAESPDDAPPPLLALARQARDILSAVIRVPGETPAAVA